MYFNIIFKMGGKAYSNLPNFPPILTSGALSSTITMCFVCLVTALSPPVPPQEFLVDGSSCLECKCHQDREVPSLTSGCCMLSP